MACMRSPFLSVCHPAEVDHSNEHSVRIFIVALLQLLLRNRKYFFSKVIPVCQKSLRNFLLPNDSIHWKSKIYRWTLFQSLAFCSISPIIHLNGQILGRGNSNQPSAITPFFSSLIKTYFSWFTRSLKCLLPVSQSQTLVGIYQNYNELNENLVNCVGASQHLMSFRFMGTDSTAWI